MASVEHPISIRAHTSTELPAQPVAEVPHDDAAEGAGDEADREGRERGEAAGHLRDLREELGPNTTAAAVP